MTEPSLYVIEHRRGPGWNASVGYLEQVGVEAHLDFMRQLAARGAMVLGGPFTDDVPDGTVGMAIVRAESLGVAEGLAAEDRSVAAGLIEARVRPWRAVMGSALESEQGS